MQNYLDIERFGHNLKGTGVGYGFDQLSRIGERLESASKSQNGGAIERLLQEFEAVLSEEREKYTE